MNTSTAELPNRRPSVERPWNFCRTSATYRGMCFQASHMGRDNAWMAELNGRPVEVEELQALALTNYGHSTSIRVDGNAVRGLAQHLGRLVRDCRILFDADLDVDRVRHLIRQALAGLTQPIIARVTVFDPELAIGHPSGEGHPTVLVTTRPAVSIPQPPLRLRSVLYERDLPAVKHVGLFGPLWHRRQAQQEGYDDALFVDAQGRISEAATANIGFIDGDRIIWPNAGTLPGVTMALISEVHTGTVSYEAIELPTLSGIEGVFATNAAIGLRAVKSIDNWSWEAEPVGLDVLRKAYENIPPEPL
jgi:branched-subunit amino acid aminotransferase/4-amino-4-deoxychorismate lyase